MRRSDFNQAVQAALQLSIVSILIVVSFGCGKADYETAMRNRAKSLELGSNFLENLYKTPDDILDGAASIQLPTYLNADKKTLRMGAKTNIGNPLSRDRIQPPGVDIPGFEFSYELFLTMQGIANKQPMYWYFGSAPADTKLSTIEARLRAQAAKLVPRANPTFVDVAITTPDGGTLPYRKLTVRGTQSFSADPDTEDVENKPGEFRIYIHSGGGRHVIIALRGTDEVIQQLDALNRAEYALGTLKVTGGAS